jgi:hypothetical protein
VIIPHITTMASSKGTLCRFRCIRATKTLSAAAKRGVAAERNADTCGRKLLSTLLD